MKTPNQNKARFDTRLLKEQKEFFERAAFLGGFRNLTDFVIATVQNKAKEIIEDSERTIASQKDQEIFFDALVSPPKPNNDLLSARDNYNKKASE